MIPVKLLILATAGVIAAGTLGLGIGAATAVLAFWAGSALGDDPADKGPDRKAAAEAAGDDEPGGPKTVSPNPSSNFAGMDFTSTSVRPNAGTFTWRTSAPGAASGLTTASIVVAIIATYEYCIEPRTA